MGSIDLMDVNGNFEKTEPFVGAIGGELMQIYLGLVEIKKLSHKPLKEEKKNQKHFKDLLNKNGLINFFLNYIKEMKNDILYI